MLKYDLIIVGAGTAGCMAGIAAAEQSSKVLMLDCKDFKEIGEKVCGDAIGKHHFKTVKLKNPPSNVIKGRMDAIFVYSPSGRHGYEVEGDGYALNRYEFGRWLLNQALDKGVEMKSNTKVISPILDKEKAIGVKVLNKKQGVSLSFLGRTVIDASGWTGVLRRTLPEMHGIVKEPPWEDFAVCYREVRELKVNIEDQNCAKIYLDANIAPQGYWWFFPQGDNLVNIGIGVKGGCGNDPKHIFKDHLANLPILKDSKILTGGGGVVPTRRPLHSLVVYGTIFAGDSGFTANPIHGGGIGQSMIAGSIAGRIAIESLSDDDPSKILWKVNKEFVDAYGMKAASLEIFKIFLQELDNEDLEFGIENRLITNSDLERLSYGNGDLSITEKARRMIRGMKRPSILRNLAETARYMNKVKKLYENYPEKEDYEIWSKSVLDIFCEFKKIRI
ncbi:MAG: NAD(P)/FAD-dependent oxidoreductase [Candidatus Methylarchaceae archaeon HK02M2]|nr:NAD(P)/FAD-dependent oxidoreductase [Candidatus Methylarchaceae archaeon HK02M2]